MAAAALLLLIGAGSAGVWMWGTAPAVRVAAMAPVRAPAPPELVRPVLPAPWLATEADILGRSPAATEVYRFAPQPEIIVVQFATLADQADALNRVAALLEKAGMPRETILESAELDRRIRASGDSPASFYLGHDYRMSDLAGFFDRLDRAGQAGTAGEGWLRARMAGWGWTAGTRGALITLVREDAEAGVDAPARATILRHELSHGAYFTDPAYAQYAQQFWRTVLTGAERARFRTFLAAEGYDTGIDDLVVNETQAFLVHTADARFFNAGAVGLAPARVDALRAAFVAGMPPGWLKACTSPRALPRPLRVCTVRRARRPQAAGWCGGRARRQRPGRHGPRDRGSSAGP